MALPTRLLRPVARRSARLDLRTIANLQVWYDAADLSTFTFGSGTEVAEWRDKSGNGRHAGQTSAGNRPSRSSTQNGLGAVAFAGTPNQWLSLTYTSFSQAPATYFFVANVSNSATLTRRLFSKSAGHIVLALSNTTFIAGNAGYPAHLTVTRPASGWTAISYRQATNTQSQSNAADAIVGSATGSVADARGYISSSDFNLGYLEFTGSENYFLGDMAEIAVYNRSLSDAERDAVLVYLRQKWAVT